MIRKSILLALLAILVFSCKEPEPRSPVQQKSGSFIKESVDRSKKILAKEQAIFKSIKDTDTLHHYFESANGFSYFYEKEMDSLAKRAETDDEILIGYTIMHLNGDTIYKTETNGVQQIKVDKTQLFPGLRNAVKLLREGEKATFLFPSSQAYGFKGDNNKIKPNVPLKTSLELLKILISKDSINTFKPIE